MLCLIDEQIQYELFINNIKIENISFRRFYYDRFLCDFLRFDSIDKTKEIYS